MRSPDPLAECRPGGRCPTCNPPLLICPDCGDVAIEDGEKRCRWCEDARRDEAQEAAADARREG